MINHKYWNQLLYPQWSRQTVVGSHSAVLGFPSRRPISAMAKLATGSGSRPARKYDIGLGLFGDGVATRLKAGTHLLQQLDPMEVPSSRLQRTGSEAGYARLNVHPILRSASICICNLLPLNYPIIPFITMQFRFVFNQLVIFKLIAEFAHYNHVHAILILAHKINKITTIHATRMGKGLGITMPLK